MLNAWPCFHYNFFVVRRSTKLQFTALHWFRCLVHIQGFGSGSGVIALILIRFSNFSRSRSGLSTRIPDLDKIKSLKIMAEDFKKWKREQSLIENRKIKRENILMKEIRIRDFSWIRIRYRKNHGSASGFVLRGQNKTGSETLDSTHLLS